MDFSSPDFPVHYQLPEPTQIHVHCISDAIQPSHPLSSPSLPTFNLSQHQGFRPCLITFKVRMIKQVIGIEVLGDLNSLVSLGFLFVCLCLCAFDHTEQHVELPWPGIEPMSPAAEAQSLNHWTTKETLNALVFYFFIAYHFQNCFNRKGTGSW